MRSSPFLPSILQRFLWRETSKSCMFVALCLMSLQVAVTLVAESTQLHRGNYTFLDSVWYSLLIAGPSSIIFILPIVMLVGFLLALGKMVDNAEMVVVLSSGVSRWRLFAYMLPLGLLISFGVMLLEDTVLLDVRNQATEHRNVLRTGKTNTNGSLAVKIGDRFIIANQIDQQGKLSGIKLFHVDDNFMPISQAESKTGIASNNRIRLFDAQVSRYTPQQVEKTIQHDIEIVTPHSLAFLHWLSFGALKEAERLHLSKLLQFARFQQDVNPHKNPFLLMFFSKLLLPINILAFMLLVFPFVFGSVRSSRTSTKIIIGIMIGLVFINFQQLTLPAHMAFGIHPLIVAMFPALVTLVAAGVCMRIWR